MAKNRHSGDCPNTTPFDREIKKRFFPTRSIPNITNIRGILEGEEAQEAFSRYMTSEIASVLENLGDSVIQEVKEKYGSSPEISAIIETINRKLAFKKELSSFEESFMQSYANAINAFLSDARMKDIVKREMQQAGASSEAPSKMHSLFKSKIPSGYRNDVRGQLVSILIQTLDRLEKTPQYKNFTRKEIIDSFKLKDTNLKGFDCLMYYVKKVIAYQYNTLKQQSEQNKAEAEHSEGVPFGGYTISEEQEAIFKTLLEDEDAWKACIYETKSLFLEAEKIKIGNKVSYVEEVEEDETDDADPEREVQSAEDEGPEHWQLKADTISSFNSMAREVRSLLYKLTTGEKGVLGFPSIVDTMLVHQTLMELRGENYCQNSSEFLEVLKNTKTTWAQELYNILINDPWKRTAVFNAYRKNHLNYVYHRKSFIPDKVLGIRVPTFYRNKSGKSARVLMGAYRAGITTIDSNNGDCLFNPNGSFNASNFLTVKQLFSSSKSVQGVSFWDDDKEVYDMSVWKTDKAENFTKEQLLERQRDFVLTVNNILNLHLDASDIDIILSSSKEFKNFCKSTHEVMQNITSLTGHNYTINFLFENSRIKKHFEKLVKAAKHTITVQERNSPVEKAFRYNKSTYMAHTVPNSLGDNLERLGKYAAQGRDTFRQYLEENFLSCPAFATKTASGYTIHNYWLKLMYEATEEDLKNPASFVNRLINECTRGLGTDSTEFSAFAEKDNYIFTLNEYLQNSVESDGKFGATPLFVTGDSNSTRFLTTPILSADEVLNEMVNNVIQEIERMQMFESMLDYFNNPDDVDPNSPEYSKRRQIKVSEGHGGKTVEEWMREPESRRPSVLRNVDKFTFFPFLNQYKEELLNLYNNPAEGDSAKVEFRAKARTLLEQHLFEMYKTFMDELKEKDIVSEFKSSDLLNKTTLSILDVNGEVLDTSNPKLLWSFYLNTKFNLIQEENLLTIDPGFYKNTEDFQKRFKENIASGDLLDLEALDPAKIETVNRLIAEGILDETQAAEYDLRVDDNNGYQKVRYIDEVLTDLDASDEEGGSQEDRDFMQALREAGFSEKEVMKKYKKNTLTDGQGYRSFTSYRKLMIMRGEPHWTKAHEEVYQIIMANRAAGRTRFDMKDPQQKAAFQRILDLGVVFQPLKPFYFGFEEIVREDGSKILVPVQHKYSEYPIIPELLPIRNAKDSEKVNKLNALGQAMEEDGTDLVCCTTCVKVGGFGSTSVKGCQTKEDFLESFKGGYEHQLKLEGWRQQSNIPEHVDSSRARGTQFTKHGYGSIAETSGNKHYSFLKRIFKRDEIKLTKNKTISIKDGLNAQNLIQLFSAIGSAPFIHASNKLNKKISNPREASDILSELRANDSRGAKDNIAAYTTDENGEIMLSPAEGMTAFDNMASLLSKLRKEVIKQPIKGGSAVQVSAFGFEDVLKVRTKKVTTSNGEKLNITHADCAMPFAFSYSYEDGTTVDLSSRFLEFVDYNTGMLLDENGEPVEPEEATGEPGKEFYGWNTKLGKQFPGILDLIAYRIPTEKDYSIINLKAKRFWPKAAGGTIMVPSQFTTIAGFDFDIDKLYFIRREYIYKKQPHISNYNIWTDYYTDTELGNIIKPYLEKAREAAVNHEEGALYLGDNDYEYWGTALDMMAAEDKDISRFPKTAEEAFSEFVSTRLSSYTQLISNYDENKTVLENSQAAVNNLFFDYMQARLEDYDTFSERYVPGGFQMLKDAKPVMMAIRYGKPKELAALVTAEDPEAALMELAKKYEDFSPDYDPTELSTIAHYQTYNALYDNCISISAVQNINQRLTALLNKLTLKHPILFGSLLKAMNNAALSRQEKEKLGADVRSRFVNGVDTELLTTNYLAASVDAVKDALLEFFGIDDKNLNIGCLMSKIGCTAIDIGLLLNQPVVRRAMEIMKESGGYKNMSNALDEAMQEIAGDNYRELEHSFYYGELASKESKDSRNNYVDTNNLIRYIGTAAAPTGLNLSNYFKGQFAVVHLMKELQADAQELAEQVAVSQSTSIKSVKSTFGAIQAVLQKAIAFALKFGGPDSMFNVELPSQLKYIINPTIRINEENLEEVLGECLESPYCMEQIAFSAIMGYADTLGDYFPYMSEGFLTLAGGLAALTNRGYISAEMFDVHNKAAMMFFLERMTNIFNEDNNAFVFDNGQLADTGMPNRIFYSRRFPEFLKNIIEINDNAFKQGITDIHYKDIPILGSISTELEGYDKGKNKQNYILKMEGIGGLNSTQKDNLIESWEAMFYSDDPMLRDIARHLFMYSYYSRGFDFGPTTFMSLVPLMLKISLEDGEYSQFFNRVFNVSGSPDGSLQEVAGNVEGISPKDYYKAFILNTKDLFYQFTKKIYQSKGIDEKSPYSIINKNKVSTHIDSTTGKFINDADITRIREEYIRKRKEELRAQQKPDIVSETEVKQYLASRIIESSYFTISVSSDDDKPLLNHVATPIKDPQTGETVGFAFTPCIEIDGATYICDSNINSNVNNQFNVIELADNVMTYYRMDVPLKTDYSKPQLYGTRDAMLQRIGGEKLVRIIKDIIDSYQHQQSVTPPSSLDDVGNTHGETTGSSDVQEESALSPLLSLADTFETKLSNNIRSGIFNNDVDKLQEVMDIRQQFIRIMSNLVNVSEGGKAKVFKTKEDLIDTLGSLTVMLLSPAFADKFCEYASISKYTYETELQKKIEYAVAVYDIQSNNTQEQQADEASKGNPQDLCTGE